MIDFPTKGARPWTLTVDQLHVWTQIYVQVDVLTEVRKAWAWCEANPSKRKTARGMPRFLVNWLNRAEPKHTISPERRAYDVWKLRGGCPHVPHCPHFEACQLVSSRSR